MSLLNSTEIQSKPFSQSCEENKEVIFNSIAPFLQDKLSVLEIASGTGQHAIYFAEQMNHLSWQTSDLIESHPGICQWLEEAKIENIVAPFEFNVSEVEHWPERQYDAVFTANSFHIMATQNVVDFFCHLPKILKPKSIVLVYGPFNYNGQFTSESNAHFNDWLKQRNPQSGIKDFEWCNQLAEKAGLTLINDIAMPQNNRILVWQNI